MAIHIPYYRNAVLNHFWYILRAAILSLKLWRRGVTVLQASDPTGGGVAAALVKAITGLPLLVHLQGDLFNLPPAEFSRIRRLLSRCVTTWVANRAERVRCVSRALMKEAVQAGVSRGKVVFVPSRCDTEQFNPVRWKGEGRRIRERMGIPPDTMVAAFVGTLSVHKGVAYLLEATRTVVLRHPEFRVLVVGAGELESQLQRQARALRVEVAVRFCGRAEYSAVAAYLAAANLFVLPSLDEGMPRVILEAMAMELPVVATRVGGVPELVRERETGLLVEAADAKQLAAALSYVLEHPAEARKWGNRARAMVEAEYSFDAGTRAYAAVLGELMGKAGIAAGAAVG